MSLTVTSDRDEIEKHPTGRTVNATDSGRNAPTFETAASVSVGNPRRAAVVEGGVGVVLLIKDEAPCRQYGRGFSSSKAWRVGYAAGKVQP